MLTFENSSNRCWFNAAVQAILHVPQLANLLRSDEIFPKILVKKRKNSSDFAVELSRVAREYWSTFKHEKVVNLDVLFEIFVKINRNFGGKKMYDATEAFLAIIETLDGAFVAKEPLPLPEGASLDSWNEHIQATKSSFLSDILLGQSKRVYKEETSYEHFSALTLSKPTVAAGIEDYLHDEDTGITREFTKLPLILPVIFQKSADKNFVHYDTSMTIGDTEYVLFAVMLHAGNLTGGHWVTMCYNAGTWCLMDDSKCSRIFDLNSLIQKESMLLLYKKKF
jgi:ubiquitin C-terminal hydrolase